MVATTGWNWPVSEARERPLLAVCERAQAAPLQP